MVSNGRHCFALQTDLNCIFVLCKGKFQNVRHHFEVNSCQHGFLQFSYLLIGTSFVIYLFLLILKHSELSTYLPLQEHHPCLLRYQPHLIHTRCFAGTYCRITELPAKAEERTIQLTILTDIKSKPVNMLDVDMTMQVQYFTNDLASGRLSRTTI